MFRDMTSASLTHALPVGIVHSEEMFDGGTQLVDLAAWKDEAAFFVKHGFFTAWIVSSNEWPA